MTVSVLGSSTLKFIVYGRRLIAVSMLPLRNMWPHGVRTKDDMARFGKLIVGPAVRLEDYHHRLPEVDMQDTFLIVSRGGCAEGTLLAELAKCVCQT